MLIELADVLYDNIFSLFRESLSDGDIPYNWNLTNISAIFKDGRQIRRLCSFDRNLLVSLS